MEEVNTQEDEVKKLQLQLSGARALNEELRLAATEERERLTKLLDAAAAENRRQREEIRSLAATEERLRDDNRRLAERLIDQVELERPPETPRDGAQRCQEPGCTELAEFSYVWPDTNTRYYGCARHAQAAAVTVAQMGRELVLEPVSRVVVE